nr:MAG TPA: hypothetical protein [Caudoviricetes sp.]DAZ51398.1 MAG TPA: hypothetical protein [Caudoviricetes sp.]
MTQNRLFLCFSTRIAQRRTICNKKDVNKRITDYMRGGADNA